MHNFSSPAVAAFHTSVIYHANCVDGFASAWAAREFLGEAGIEYISCVYEKLPDIKDIGQIIYIVDFSFSRTILKDLCEIHKKVIVLDHHKTAEEALTNWEDKPENPSTQFA